MVTQSDYPPDSVEICLSVLVEFVTIIGAYKEDVVLVGGWVPYFLCEAHKKEHTGSMDIDVALDFPTFSTPLFLRKPMPSRNGI